MRSIEAEGKTVKEAIKIALAKLKVPRARAKIKILSEETKGLFGMRGQQPAKVRVTVTDDTEEKTQHKNQPANPPNI